MPDIIDQIIAGSPEFREQVFSALPDDASRGKLVDAIKARAAKAPASHDIPGPLTDARQKALAEGPRPINPDIARQNREYPTPTIPGAPTVGQSFAQRAADTVGSFLNPTLAMQQQMQGVERGDRPVSPAAVTKEPVPAPSSLNIPGVGSFDPGMASYGAADVLERGANLAHGIASSPAALAELSARTSPVGMLVDPAGVRKAAYEAASGMAQSVGKIATGPYDIAGGLAGGDYDRARQGGVDTLEGALMFGPMADTIAPKLANLPDVIKQRLQPVSGPAHPSQVSSIWPKAVEEQAGMLNPATGRLYPGEASGSPRGEAVARYVNEEAAALGVTPEMLQEGAPRLVGRGDRAVNMGGSAEILKKVNDALEPGERPIENLPLAIARGAVDRAQSLKDAYVTQFGDRPAAYVRDRIVDRLNAEKPMISNELRQNEIAKVVERFQNLGDHPTVSDINDVLVDLNKESGTLNAAIKKSTSGAVMADVRPGMGVKAGADAIRAELYPELETMAGTQDGSLVRAGRDEANVIDFRDAAERMHGQLVGQPDKASGARLAGALAGGTVGGLAGLAFGGPMAGLGAAGGAAIGQAVVPSAASMISEALGHPIEVNSLHDFNRAFSRLIGRPGAEAPPLPVLRGGGRKATTSWVEGSGDSGAHPFEQKYTGETVTPQSGVTRQPGVYGNLLTPEELQHQTAVEEPPYGFQSNPIDPPRHGFNPAAIAAEPPRTVAGDLIPSRGIRELQPAQSGEPAERTISTSAEPRKTFAELYAEGPGSYFPQSTEGSALPSAGAMRSPETAARSFARLSSEQVRNRKGSFLEPSPSISDIIRAMRAEDLRVRMLDILTAPR